MMQSGKVNQNSFYVDNTDEQSIQRLIDAFEARGTRHESAIRRALSVHDRPFLLYIDLANAPLTTSLQDPFTFNPQRNELVFFNTDAAALIDAIIEMAMFLRGFETLLDAEEEWHTQIASSAWRRVRHTIKMQLGLAAPVQLPIPIEVDSEATTHYNLNSFVVLAFFAGMAHYSVVFPHGANSLCVAAYYRLARMMEAMAYRIGLEDYQTFNHRLKRVVRWIESSLAPRDNSPFDNLLGPDGFADEFFEDNPED